jgi:hypothetical protein
VAKFTLLVGGDEVFMAPHTAPECLALTSLIFQRMSAFSVAIWSKADMTFCGANVCF